MRLVLLAPRRFKVADMVEWPCTCTAPHAWRHSQAMIFGIGGEHAVVASAKEGVRLGFDHAVSMRVALAELIPWQS